MTTIFDSSRNVKPASFGRGIAPARRERRAPYTSADLAWAASELNRDATDYDVLAAAPRPVSGGAPEPDWDTLAALSRAVDLLSRGLDGCDHGGSFMGHSA